MKHLTIINLTSDNVSFSHDGQQTHSAAVERPTILLPSARATVQLKSFKNPFNLFRGEALLDKASLVDEKHSFTPVQPDVFTIRVPMSLSASWRAVKVEEGCPWRVYRNKVSKGTHNLLILPRRNLGSFLSEMPDSLPLSSLVLPGTHDTMALYGWPISQCQSLSTPLPVQLQSGIRVLDVRLSLIQGSLIAYHGIYPQRTSFQTILSVIHGFLTSPLSSNETIIMSIKQEDFMITPWHKFSLAVRDDILQSETGNGFGTKDGMWFLENRIPTLGEVRGKVVLFSRFGGDGSGWDGGLEGMGIHPSSWPDSEKEGFSWECKETVVRTHDWYNIPSFLSIPEKTSLSTQILLSPSASSPPTLSISFFSAASFPLGLPPTIARGFGWPKIGFGVEGVNARVGKWLLDLLASSSSSSSLSMKNQEDKKEERVRGWPLMDFYEDPEQGGLIPLFVEFNFRGRVQGEEGWWS